MGLLENMTTDNSNIIKCDFCDYALPINATVCPNCGANLSLIKLIEKIPRAEPRPVPSAVPVMVKQPEGYKSDKAYENVLAPGPLPEPSVPSPEPPEFELEHGEIRQSQVEDSFFRNTREEEPVPVSNETGFPPPQDHVELMTALPQADYVQSSPSHGFSRVWILFAISLAGLIFLSIAYFEKSNQLQVASKDLRNSQNTVVALNQSLGLTPSTISTQQNSISTQQNPILAQQTPPDNQISSDKTLLVGPLDGTLVHNNDGLLKTYWAEQNSENFILNVVLVNPYANTFHPWDTCIRFRRNYTDEYRLTIFSNRQWALTWSLSTEPIASGILTNLKTGEGESNTVLLEVRDSIASLEVNDMLVPNMDVSAYQEAGDVGIAIGSRKGDEVDGKTTVFKEFTLWNIP